MLSTLSTAIIAFFLIISLSGTMLFPMMAFADEPQPVAQVGNTTYMSVQDAIGHTSMKNNTVTLLTDTTESITITPSKVVRGITLELNGHALNASNTTAITIPANMQLTITGSGMVVGGDNPAIDCRGASRIQGGNFTSNTTLMRFAETGSASAEASISAGTFTAPTLIGMLNDAEHLGYVSIRDGEYHGAIPAGLDTLVLMGGSFSTTENLTPYLADMAGLIPNGDDSMFDISELAISSDYPTVELEQGSTLQKLTNDSLLDLTRTKLNGISDYRLVADAEQLQALNRQIELALQAVAKRKAFDAVSQTVTITATRNETTDGGADPQFRTSGHDEISTQVTVNIKSIAKPEEPDKPNEPSKPAEPKQPDMPRTGSAVQALAVISLLLVIASAICAYATVHLQSSRLHN